MKKSIVFSVLLLSFSSLAHAGKEELDKELVLPVQIRKTTVAEDQDKLFAIYADHGSNACRDYVYFGNKIIKLLEIQNVDADELGIIKSTYLKQLKEDKFGLDELTWMSIQAAMALTPQERRATPNNDLSGDVPRLIRNLNKKEDGIEKWKLPLSDQEGAIEDNILTGNMYFSLMPVIAQDINDKAVFTKNDYLKGIAGKEIWGEQRSIYLYSLSGKIGSIHGGIYQTPIEVILHDLAHVGGQVGSRFNRDTQGQVDTYGWYLSIVRTAAESAGFNQEETKSFNSILFYALHEVLDPLSDRFSKYPKTDLSCAHKGAIQMLKNWCNDCINDMTNSHSIFSLEYIEGRRMNNIKRYKLLKQFHRDRAYDLIEDGFLSKEDVLTEDAKILGTTYKLEPVHAKLTELVNWLQSELEEGGRLYKALAETSKN